MKTNIFTTSVGIILLAVLCIPLTAPATSYPPTLPFHHMESGQESFMKGSIIYLFHSGTKDVRNAVHDNDLLIVYRLDSSCILREVGKIRALFFVGDTHLKGEVIEGIIKPSDIARKGKVSFLIISVGPCNY